MFIDVTGSTINKGSRFQTHVSSACMAEALAVRDALIHASTLGFTKIWLRSNAQELVRAIKAHGKSFELQGVLSYISLLSSSFLFLRLSYVSRLSKPAFVPIKTSWTFSFQLKYQLLKKKRKQLQRKRYKMKRITFFLHKIKIFHTREGELYIVPLIPDRRFLKYL